MKRFNGNRLQFARQYNGLSSDDLAKLIKVSSQAISQYETGKTTPQFDKLISLSEVLHFPCNFFLQDSNIQIESGSAYFRSLMKTPKKYRVQQKLKIELLAEIYSVLSDYIEFPELSLPTTQNIDDIETVAETVRAFWKIGNKPITNLLRFLEERGIIVTSFPTPTTDIDAFSQYFIINKKPLYIIAFSENKQTAARINFDLAHELGHIMLHSWSDDIETYSREEFKNHEKQANAFASAFLLPKDEFVNDLRYYNTDLNHYTELKKKWHVSISAMLYRACNLNLITQYQYQYLMRTMNAKNMRISEPLDRILEVPTPHLLRDAVEMLITNDVFSRSELLSELSLKGLSLEPTEIENLLALPKGTLDISKDKKQGDTPIILKFRE
jgi:Zn-dependent peptidase ImmA (M78 family)/DNA-binding XRE family transcriptional regulator